MRHHCDVRASTVPAASTPASRTTAFATWAILIVPLLASACGPAVAASAHSTYEQRALVPVGRQSSSDRVARAELAPLADLTFEEALRRLRPEWLRPSPTTRQAAEPGVASVYVNDAYVGGLDALRLIPIDAVTNARYLTPSAARSWFGMFCHCAGGVILVSTRTDE